MLIGFGDVEGWEPLDMPAVRWFEAATAAADGSRFEESAIALPSGMDWGRWVGELFFGVEPRNSRFVENLRDKLLPIFSGGICAVIGDTPLSSG